MLVSFPAGAGTLPARVTYALSLSSDFVAVFLSFRAATNDVHHLDEHLEGLLANVARLSFVEWGSRGEGAARGMPFARRGGSGFWVVSCGAGLGQVTATY
jgi:hypothetical protein